MDIDKLKNIIQDCNLNFLMGSGLSVPFFSTLANVEILLENLNDSTKVTEDEREIIRASILGKYFETVINRNSIIIDDTKTGTKKTKVLENYKNFLLSLNTIILKRKSSILNKQVNIFTTNIDVFFEKALELLNLEYNDGFYGTFLPSFSITNFKKSVFTKSLHYDNNSEIPVFNLLKLHGSLTWARENNRIVFSWLEDINEIESDWEKAQPDLIDFDITAQIDILEKEVKGKTLLPSHRAFIESYSKLSIINPTKQKFQDTILTLQYYELLRIFSNELEKENSILFIMGFSLADEHIREIVLRAANSNPTLLILILAYDSDSKEAIEENLDKGNTAFRYQNIHIYEPESGKNFDFKGINDQIFGEILKTIV